MPCSSSLEMCSDRLPLSRRVAAWRYTKSAPTHDDSTSRIAIRAGSWMMRSILVTDSIRSSDMGMGGLLARVDGLQRGHEQPMVAELHDRERGGNRSEERRVGKECRSRWSPY